MSETPAPTCGWKISRTQACGAPTNGKKITLKGPTGYGEVLVCDKHKAQHNREAARVRTVPERG